MTRITIDLLAGREDRAVFPLQREATPSPTLASWLRFARRLRAIRPIGHGGIVGARYVGQPFPSGLFCFRVTHDLEHRRVLTADHFVAIDPLDSGLVLRALLTELDTLAQRLECATVQGVVRARQAGLAGGMVEAGLNSAPRCSAESGWWKACVGRADPRAIG